jgi:hypothetical protein
MGSDKGNPKHIGLALVLAAACAFTLHAHLAARGKPQEAGRAGHPGDAGRARGTDIGEGAAEAGIVFDSREHNFGRVVGADAIAHEFQFLNRCAEPVEIEQVSVACGCTVPGEYDKTVKPGERGRIPVVLHTEGLNGDIEKSIQVVTQSPARWVVKLSLKGTVWQPILVEPSEANMGLTVEKDKPLSITLKLTNRAEEALEVKGVRSDKANFKADLKTVVPGKEFEIAVAAVPPFDLGANAAAITVETSNPRQPKLSLAAYLYLQTRVEASPTAILLPKAPLKDSVIRPVYVWANDDFKLRIAKTEVDTPLVELQTLEETPNKRFRVMLLMPSGVRLPGEATLVISTNHPECPALTVKIRHIQ